ncbi:MAG: hypothetical protein IPP33_06730 [Flavobacteriales bacterium]|nr:hypothetical protein [Flavobacteriales bacterium]
MTRGKFFLWLLAGPMSVLAAMLAVAHPHLAVTERSGGDVLVVEGWMQPPHLEQVAHLADSLRYQRIYTTGSVRPFAYYLRVGESIDVRFASSIKGTLRLNVSGNTGGGFRVIAGQDTVLERSVEPVPAVFVSAQEIITDHLLITSLNAGQVDHDRENIFIQFMSLGGENVHLLQTSTWFIRTDGKMEPAWPTYAHKAAADLIQLGMNKDHVISVPSWGKPDSRSWANANYFAIRAQKDTLKSFDVVTVGVHARRSRELFRRACGSDMRVGVISLEDPNCPASGWWRKRSGWIQMLKEIGGSSEPIAVDLTH